MRSIQSVIFLLVICFQSASYGHEYWIEPDAYQYRAGDLVRIRSFVGERFKGESLPRDEKKIDHFTVHGSKSETPVRGQSGSHLSLTRLKEEDSYVVSFRSKRSSITLEARKFENYLKHEGLEHIISLRKARGESSLPGNEVYSRCAKSLIGVGEKAHRNHDKAVGLPLEILLISDPSAVKKKQPFVAQVTYEGKPLANAQVVAIKKNAADSMMKARTDERGRVEFPIDDAGVWMLTTIHMLGAPEDVDADWESLWASFTFQVEFSPNPTDERQTD